jgi:hypothetical protein
MRSRTTARIVGTLFIIATAAGLSSVALLGPTDAVQSLTDVAAHKTRITLSALMIVVMAAAIAIIPAILFPVLKRHNEALALCYVVTRTVEVVLLLPAAIGPLLLLAVSSGYSTGAPDDGPQFRTLRTVSLTYAGWGGPVSAVFFCLSVILLNYLLYRSHLVPRLISAWALVAVAPYLVDGLSVMFGVLSPSSPLHSLLIAPLALNEMVLALWLLAKGFRPPAMAYHHIAEASVRARPS